MLVELEKYVLCSLQNVLQEALVPRKQATVLPDPLEFGQLRTGITTRFVLNSLKSEF